MRVHKTATSPIKEGLKEYHKRGDRVEIEIIGAVKVIGGLMVTIAIDLEEDLAIIAR